MVDGKTANREPVNCQHVWREISNYLEGEVDSALRAAMDQHFGTCKRCASVLEGTRNVVRLYSDERMIEVPSGFGRRLEKRLAQRARATTSRWSTWSAWLVPVAALVLITGGLDIASSLTNPHPMQSEHAQPAHGIPPEMQVVVSAGAKVFHAPGCDFIHNKDQVRTVTAKQAVEQGYIPCLRCMRKYLDTASAGRLSGESEFVAETDADDRDDQTSAGKP